MPIACVNGNFSFYNCMNLGKILTSYFTSLGVSSNTSCIFHMCFHMWIKFHRHVKCLENVSHVFSHCLTFHTFVSHDISKHKKFHMDFTVCSHIFHMRFLSSVRESGFQVWYLVGFKLTDINLIDFQSNHYPETGVKLTCGHSYCYGCLDRLRILRSPDCLNCRTTYDLSNLTNRP